MSLSDRTTELLVASVGEIDNADDLHRLIRKCNRTLKKIDVPTPMTPAQALSLGDVNPGDALIIGTPKGEQTKVRVLKVNRKRVKVELLEKRGKKKSYKKGTEIDIYPDMLRARA